MKSTEFQVKLTHIKHNNINDLMVVKTHAKHATRIARKKPTSVLPKSPIFDAFLTGQQASKRVYGDQRVAALSVEISWRKAYRVLCKSGANRHSPYEP